MALEHIGTAPAEVDYISLHGTGTKANDAVQTRPIRAAPGDPADDVPVSSPKMVGHLIGAAGALSAMAALLATRDGVIPPTERQRPGPSRRRS